MLNPIPLDWALIDLQSLLNPWHGHSQRANAWIYPHRLTSAGAQTR